MTRIFLTLCIFCLSEIAVDAQVVRAIDGKFNNVFNIEWGSRGDVLSTTTSNGFGDQVASLSGEARPNPRVISNHMFLQSEPIWDNSNLSDFVWVFGQFIDHDIVLVESDPTEPLYIEIPQDDKVFTPGSSPMTMFRSAAINDSGLNANNPRRYSNSITAFIDGSGVYGSDEVRARWLRTLEDGKLKTSAGNLMPWNTTSGEFNDPKDPDAPFMADDTRSGTKLFVAGDIRANENPLLTAMHTLFVREHNRLCDEIKARDNSLEDEEIYQEARLWVGGFIQSIVYNQWLQSLGITLPAYNGYRDDVNPQISNVFSASAFRVGHTLINSNIIRLEPAGVDIPAGDIRLKDAYFNPVVISLAGGIEPYLRGMASQVQQQMDCKVVDDVRNFLFGSAQSEGLDLAAININRGRERGLPDFNTIRSDIGLPKIKGFNELTKDHDVQVELRDMYNTVDDIDPWVGMLAEDYMPKAILGSTMMLIIKKQFQALRDGDRFFFMTDRRLSPEDIEKIMSTTLRDIIMRNTEIKIMQDNVFQAMSRDLIVRGPEVEQTDLSATAYPNPSNGIFEIKIFANEDQDLALTVFDIQGQIVSRSTHSLEAGDNFIPFDMSGRYEGGMYNILIEKGQLEYKIIRVILN